MLGILEENLEQEPVMSRGPQPRKVQQWTDRLSRFVKSKQTVSQFCLSEGISQPSFYQWKKKLAANKDFALAGRTMSGAKVFKPVELRSVIQTATTIRVGGDIEIQLGNDLPTVAAVVGQLVKQATDSARNGGC